MVTTSLRKHYAYWLALSEFKGFNHEIAIDLLNRYGSLEKAVKAPANELAELFTPLSKLNVVKEILHDLAYFEEMILEMISDGISIVTLIGEGYPKILSKIPNPPLTLFVRGNLPNFDKKQSVAIVGTRNPSEYAKDLTYKIAKKLASMGIIIVSGLAFGIDSQAHLGALDANGMTIAVLPSYVGNVVPKTNIEIANRILDSGGALVSEYLPDVEQTRDKYVRRNRIIAALSESSIIAEGTIKSGTRHQARYAQEIGRPLFVLEPIDKTLPTSQLPILLKKEGAKFVKDEVSALKAITSLRRIKTIQTKLEGI